MTTTRRGRFLCLHLGVILLAATVDAEQRASVENHERAIRSVAERYLAAIEAQDWSTMESLLATDARYRDPTMTHFGIAAIDLVGPPAIVGFWRQSSADSGTLSIEFQRDEFYLAGPNVVLEGTSAVVVRGAAWNLPLDEVSTRFPLVTHLRIEDGLVSHHIDLVDYAVAEGQIIEQVDRHNQQHGTTVRFPRSPVAAALLEEGTNYLAAVHRDEWNEAERWLTTDSQYLNYTAEALIGSIERAEGGDAILSLFRRAREKSETVRLHFDVDSSFVSGDCVVFSGIYRVTTRGSAWGVDRPTVEFALPMIVLLRFGPQVEGTPEQRATDATRPIVEHVEWMNYSQGLAASSTAATTDLE